MQINTVSVIFREKRLRKSLSLIRGLNPKKILDVGCGEGQFLSMLAKQFPSAELYGCDTSKQAIAKISKECPKAKMYQGDFMEGKFEPVDLISILEVVEHNKNPEEFIKKVALLVGKGGHILISIPRPELLRWRVIWAIWSNLIYKKWQGQHTELTEKELIKICSDAGLVPKKQSRFFMDCISIVLFEVKD